MRLSFWIKFKDGKFQANVLLRLQEDSSWNLGPAGKEWVNLLAYDDHGYYRIVKHEASTRTIAFTDTTGKGHFELEHVPLGPYARIVGEDERTVWIGSSRNRAGQYMSEQFHVKWVFFAGYV